MECQHEKLIKKYGLDTNEVFYVCAKCRLVIIKNKKKPSFNMDNIKKK